MPVSPARAAAFDVLRRVATEDAFAADLLNSERLNHLSAADHALTMQLVMGTLRWQSLLDAEIATHVGGSAKVTKLDIEVLIAIRLGAYQLQYLDRIPARAAVNESVEMVKRARKRSAAPLVNAVLRKIAGTPRWKEPAEDPMLEVIEDIASNLAAPARTVGDGTPESLAHDYAHPEWLVRRWVEQFGIERAQKICKYNQSQPRITLRLISKTAEQQLLDEGIQLRGGSLLSSSREVEKGNVTRTRAYQQGDVAIQDEASQLIALLVGRGERILDCCAAPGGKTAAIAARNPAAEVIAVELHAHRARTMHKLVRASNVRIIAADAQHLPFSNRFDRVLADVPCSGTGTLARNPEIKWKLTPADLDDLASRQLAILLAAMDQVRPGGRLVYSTCSLEQEEDENVVTSALHSRNDFRLLDCRDELQKLRDDHELAWSDLDSLCSRGFLRTIPGEHPCDGFFAAIFQRIT